MLIIFIGLLLVFFLIGVPVAVALALSGVVYLLAVYGFEVFPVIAQRVFAGVVPFPLLAVPFFILTGIVMNEGRLTDRIFRFVSALLGNIHGSLAIANVGGSLIMAGMSGSALADAAGLGLIEIKAMKDAGYDPAYSAAITAASSVIGPIFPPSIPFVIYGALSGISVTSLFIGGILPGLLLSGLLALTCWILAKMYNHPSERRPSLSKLLRYGLEAIPSLIAPVILIGGIVFGWFTPTEASVIAALIATLSGLFVYRDLNFVRLIAALEQTVIFTSKVMIIVAGAAIYSWVLSYEGVPGRLAEWLGQFASSPATTLFIASLIALVLGCFFDSTSILIMTAPIIIPMGQRAGLDPVHFGVVYVFALMIGLITPPVGVCIYPVCEAAGITLVQFMRQIWVFYLGLVICLVLLAVFPSLVLWLV